MEPKKINSFVVVGSGSAGWLAAVFLSQRKYDVTVIESPDIPTIGVGESTQPLVTSYIDFCGLTPDQWMPQSAATYKLGVMFEGWGESDFIVDSESAAFHNIDGSLGTEEVACATGMSPADYMKWMPPYRLAKNNISPRIGKERYNYLHGHYIEPPNAVQWDNIKLQDHLRNVCLERGVKLVTDNVVDAKLDSQGYVEHLITKENGNISGDFYIDCTGFNAVIAEKIYGTPWLSVENFLPNNNAVVVRKKYKNPQQECHPYTLSKTMNAGWRWSIPTYNDISFGYVYSDKYIDKDDAEKELRESINEWDEPAIYVPFRAGIRQKVCFKNVLSSGLAAGFVEPLEATSLAFTCVIVGDFNRALYELEDHWPHEMDEFINIKFSRTFNEIAAFIFMHYHASTRRDNEYWRDRDKIDPPDFMMEVYNKMKQAPIKQTEFAKIMMKDVPLFKYLDPPTPMFSAGHWFQLLRSCGWYKDWKPELSQDSLKYGQHVMNHFTKLTDDIIKLFPNHYDYLTEWYK